VPDGRGFEPGTLRCRIAAATRRATASGALVPIDTEGDVIADGGLAFIARKARGLVLKDEDRKKRRQDALPADPFLPWEPDLFVADVSASHVALLNKFNVIEQHLLIVTRAFEHQERWLTAADLAALAACLAEFDSLGFYNGGTVAGASQPHKHLQLVPLPLAPGGKAFPAAGVIAASLPRAGAAQVAGFPFLAAVTRLERAAFGDADFAAAVLAERYKTAMARAGLKRVEAADGPRQSAPYNLLVTRDWLLVVPRSREFADGISINALGYAGSLFVRNDEELARLRSVGPMRVLASVSVSR
jgi:ATP adenylyltransferase